MEDAALVGVEQVVERERIGLLDGVGEVGADLDRGQVRHDQQRRVLERLAVLEELVVGLAKVRVPALVLPGEGPTLPDVGPALAALLLGGALLEGEPLARGIRVGGRGMADEAAEIDEVLLRGGALLQVGSVAPLVDERARGEGG